MGTIAGCSESDSGGDSDGGDSTSSVSGDSSSDGTTREELVNDRRNVPEDEYYQWQFDVNQAATFDFQFTVREGPEVDVFVLPEDEYNSFTSNERFRVASRSSGTAGSDTAALNEGTFYLVLDNTNAGWVSPPTNFDDDIADVEIEATIES